MKFSNILAIVRRKNLFEQFYRSRTPNAFLREHRISSIEKEEDLNDCQFPSLIKAFFIELKYDYEKLKEEIQITEYKDRTPIQNAIAASENIPYIPRKNEDELKKEISDGIKLRAVFKAPKLEDYKPAIFRGTTANEMHEDWSRKDDYLFIIGNTTRSNLPLFAHDHSLVECFRKSIDNEAYFFTFAMLSKLGYYTNYMPNKPYFGDLMDRYVEILKEFFTLMSACMITGSNGIKESKYPHNSPEFYQFELNSSFESIYNALLSTMNIQIGPARNEMGTENNDDNTRYNDELDKKISAYPGLREYLNSKNRGDSMPLFTMDQITQFFNVDRPDLKEKYLRTIKNMRAFNLQFSDNDEFSYERMEMSVRYKWILISYVYEFGKGPEMNSKAEFSTFYKALMTEKFMYDKVGGYCHEYSTIDFSKENHRKLLELSHEGIPSTFRTSMLKRATGGTKLSFIRFIITVCTNPIVDSFGPITQSFLNIILICQQEGVPVNTYIMNPQWGHEKDSCELLDQKLSILLRIILCNGDVDSLKENYDTLKNMFYSNTVMNLNAVNSVIADKDKNALIMINGNQFTYKDEIITLNEFIYFFQTILCDQHHFPMKVYNHTIGKIFGKIQAILDAGLGLTSRGWINNDIDFEKKYTTEEIKDWNESHKIAPISNIAKEHKKKLADTVNKLAKKIIKYEELMTIVNNGLTKNKRGAIERDNYLEGPGYKHGQPKKPQGQELDESESEILDTESEYSEAQTERSSLKSDDETSKSGSDDDYFFDWDDQN